jgi:hypothetical protein
MPTPPKNALKGEGEGGGGKCPPPPFAPPLIELHENRFRTLESSKNFHYAAELI